MRFNRSCSTYQVCLCILALTWSVVADSTFARGADIDIESLAELARCATLDDHVVTLKPGRYRMTDLLTPDAIRAKRERKDFSALTFSGARNTFRLQGVVIEFDTAIRGALKPPIHTDEFIVAGDGTTLEGLTIVDVGEGKSQGGAVLGIIGCDVTIKNCTIEARGSAPYGYGDLFGKGGLKKSGVHITGDGARIIGCRAIMHSFGHGFYLQEDVDNVRFENCSVEGKMRNSTKILAETSGLAFDRKFQMTGKLRGGETKILPNYMKALSEDAFRTYGQHKNLTLENCTAKNMRGGFELRTKEGVRLKNCTAIGNERGFWVGSGARLVGCRGDASCGPLLFVDGDETEIDLELLPDESTATIHAVAVAYGMKNRITLRAAQGKERATPLPILLGYGMPPAGEGMAPYPTRKTSELRLRNETTSPISLGETTARCAIETFGPVTEDAGRDNVVTRISQE